MSADGSRQRSITWTDPIALAAQGSRLSGIDFLRKVLCAEIPLPPIATLLNIVLLEVAPGRVVFGAEPQEYHYNGFGTVHGGLASVLFDCAMPCAIATTLETGVTCSTTDLHVRFLRSLTMLTGPVTCEGVVVYRGKRHATAEGRLCDAGSRLLGTATAACSIHALFA